MDTFLDLERCLLPWPETITWNNGDLEIKQCSLDQKVSHVAKNAICFIGLLVASPFTLTYEWLTKEKSVVKEESIANLNPPSWPPEMRGFATSLFQTSGLGTPSSAAPPHRGICDWAEWMQNKKILAPENFDHKEFFTDILTDPTVYIQMLKSQNVTAHRFSLEWSVIEPNPGEIDEEAVQFYRNFIQKLTSAGITPTVTLCHFTSPKWFQEAGGFQKLENIDLFVDFAMTAIELFPEVKDWWSFNEIGVKAFQQMRGAYPPDADDGTSYLKLRAYKAGIATRNSLIAHCKLHKKVTAMYPEKKIGVTHQWLKFDTENGNWLEKLAAYRLTKLSFSPVFEFFKTGRYAYEIPFLANIQFDIPKEEFETNSHFLMKLGVQAYPKPMLKLGLNHGRTYPGHKTAIQNLPLFSFGASCEPGGTVMRFGPRWRAEEIENILDEAFELTDQVYITEYGSDAMIHKWGKPDFEHDPASQAYYLKELTEKIEDYSKKRFREIKGIFCWSDLTRQLEWENGHECRLGIIDPIIDANRSLTGWNPTPASEYLKNVYK